MESRWAVSAKSRRGQRALVADPSNVALPRRMRSWNVFRA